MNMPEMLWESGQAPCIVYKATCRTRPCTVAQGAFCCKECLNYEQCESACKMNNGKSAN